jgi:Mrp family chromosome partitioning ATPase
MFRVISGAGSDMPHHEPMPEQRHVATADPFGGEAVPFVEVGGPDGVVASVGSRGTPSAQKAVQPPEQVVRPTPAPQPAKPQPQPVPRRTPPPEPQVRKAQPVPPVTDSRILSVTFHPIPKAGLRLMQQTGVAPEIVAYHFPDHPVSGEYRTVRDQIVRQFDEPGPKVTLFTSANAHAGTTTVLVNFAVSLIQEYGSRVLLVDAHLARPGVARRLGAAEAPGLADVLNQSIPLAWALQPTPVTNLHLLAAGTPTDTTEEQMATDLPKLVTQLRQWFDWVVIDAGVWGDLPGSDGTCGAADAVYLVTRSGDIELPGFGGLRAEVTDSGGHVRGYISTRQ